eukprot:Phypoly_transcript_02638.p1 GENE.Phypoly_transcript_02638~~Phypoly_transcript_02638.p1  ORF type:complete len:903 (+),score=166.28 Phypoly_transcript_02638:306-2711(+)
MATVTDTLVKCTQLAKSRTEYLNVVDALKEKVIKTTHELLGSSNAELAKIIEDDIANIKDLLKAMWLTRNCPIEMEELLVGFGELWSAQTACAVLQRAGHKALWLDARQVLFVEKGDSGAPFPEWTLSKAALGKWLEERVTPDIVAVVITGFIAATPAGLATTLRRNGSDYSASIFAALLNAAKLTIWKDVDGVYSADPRKVKEVVLLPEVSFNEAMELAYFGAKIIHPQAMAPAVDHNIPIHIRNVFHPERPGSVIKGNIKDERGELQVVRGFSTVPGISLINVEGTGMMGVPGIANRIFGALKEVQVSVVLISQASSEHSICFAIPDDQGTLAQKTVEKAFFFEINHYKSIQKVELITNCCILAAVGDQMANTPGLAAKFFGALGDRDINILAIAQGSSERNISGVIKNSQATEALQAVHSMFFRPYDPMVLSVGIIGPGLVGAALLDQLFSMPHVSQTVSKFIFQVRGICDSKKMLIKEDGIDLAKWRDGMKGATEATNLDKFVESIQKGYPRHAIIVDCTSSEQVALQYPKWLERRVHVVAPNKRAFSGPLTMYHDIKKAMLLSGRHCLYETTVGAGLPIIQTIQQMRATGDRVTRIEGIFSGTLSFIFNTFSSASNKSETKFSDIVKEAKKRGYTEPDPRDDLSGMDFARKILILARESGLELQLQDMQVQNLVTSDPASPALSCLVPEFIDTHLPSFDEKWNNEKKTAEAQGKVLRYVGVIDMEQKEQKNVASVGIRQYSLDHPFASLQGCDNVIAIYTARYSGTPMIVQGPGAGAEVTAAGVFGDLFRIACYMV